ncbi:hypothetical protein SLA2020_201980 [Shorea laevis]
MLSEIETVKNIPEFIAGVNNRKRKMSGFRHRVYKIYDLNAKVIKKLAEEVFSIVGRDPLIDVFINSKFSFRQDCISTAVCCESIQDDLFCYQLYDAYH